MVLATIAILVSWFLFTLSPLWTTDNQNGFVEDFPQSGEINAVVESEENAFPVFVQSGTVEIGDPDDISTYNMVSYRFGKRIPGERALMADEGKAYGIYVLQDNFLKKVEGVEDLKNGDYIYVTFYETPAWSDSDRKGKTLMGIVDSLERQGGEISFRFLNDSSQAEYKLTQDADLRTEDFEALFDFGDDVFDNIRRGNILRILLDDKNYVRSAAVIAPPVNVTSGKVKQIESLGVDQYRLILEDDGKRSFSLDGKSKVVKRGEPDNPKAAADLKKGVGVNLVYYNNLNHYTVLSLDFQEQ